MNERPYANVKVNPRFERGWNILQSAIQVIVGIVVVAGLLGAFGTGPLSKTTVVGAGGTITVSYDRILRRTVQSDVTIDFSRGQGERLVVDMSSPFVREMDIVTTSPRSTTMNVTSDGIAYVFDTGGADHGEITLSMKPKSFGLFESSFKIGNAAISLHQLVWP